MLTVSAPASVCTSSCSLFRSSPPTSNPELVSCFLDLCVLFLPFQPCMRAFSSSMCLRPTHSVVWCCPCAVVVFPPRLLSSDPVPARSEPANVCAIDHCVRSSVEVARSPALAALVPMFRLSHRLIGTVCVHARLLQRAQWTICLYVVCVRFHACPCVHVSRYRP